MKFHPRFLVSLLAGVLAFPAGAASAAGAAPIPLAPDVYAVNVHEPFEYFVNPFTVVGLKDHPAGTRIAPRGEFVLGDGVILKPLVGPALAPLRPGIKATLLKGWLPVVKREFVVNDAVRIAIEAFACPVLNGHAAFDRPTGEDFLTLVRVTLASATGSAVEGVAGFEREPEGALELRPAAQGGMLLFCNDALVGCVRAPRHGRAETRNSRLILRAPLAGVEEASFDLVFPFLAGGADAAELLEAAEKLDARLQAAVAFWEGLLARGAALTVPEDKVRETYLASLVYQFIGRDRGEVHAGEGFYDRMYLRDGAYQALSLAHAGYLDEALESMDLLLGFAKPDGQLVSQSGQLDANGYGMWAPVELAELSGDLEWLRRAYPRIRAAARWAMRARRGEKDPGSPFFGVLPAALADGENLWAGKNHIVGYDWWNLRGIGCVAKAARMLGEDAEAREFEAEFEDYRAAILKALARTGLDYIPPSYEKDGTHWGNLEVVFPTPLLAPHHPLVGATLRHVRTEFGNAAGPKGFIEGTMQWTPQTGAIHPYMSQFVTNTHVARGEQAEAVAGLYAFLLHTTATHGFPEGVYWRKREAWGGTVPHLWAAALYVTTLRNLLVREDEDARGGVLHLLSAVPDHWLDAGKKVGLARAPTRDGIVSFRVEAGAEELALHFHRATRRSKSRLELHLPPTLVARRAEHKGAPVECRENVVLLGAGFEGEGEPVRIRIERRSSSRPVTFQSTVAAYEAEAPDSARPIPGLLPAPPAAVSVENCLKLDLAAAATTNPFDGPFLVRPAPAFTGLAVGDLEAGGIPFRTVDPAKNGGKGIVVLAGAQACRDLPVEAVVPAGGAQGKYLAVLGGVTGWAPGEPGVGRWGAVAECVVRYADGSRSVLPWIPGRTADDWLAAPHATEVAAVLRGSRWHLNVLVLALEPKPIEAVVIRDLGTPSSPVVAAMTIVR